MKIIITGTTGMVGEGVLLACLDNTQITEILSVSRKTTGYEHPKLKEYLVSDFLALKPNDEKLKGYDACFFCAGVSSVGMSEADYTKITYDTTLNFAKAVSPNPAMTFVYISGAGTDSTEKSRTMWARVKGKTENDLRKLPFKNAFAFRPGAMEPYKRQRFAWASYPYMRYLEFLFPLAKKLFPKSVNTLEQVGNAMIYASQNGYEKYIVEVKDITILAERGGVKP